MARENPTLWPVRRVVFFIAATPQVNIVAPIRANYIR